MLNSFKRSVMARLNTDDYTQSFSPVRYRVRPSDLDMILEQNGWVTIVEGKSVSPSDLKSLKSKEDTIKWYFNSSNIKDGQRILLENLTQKGIFTCVSLNAYILREGYNVGSSTSEGMTKEWVEGPTLGDYHCHPYKHVVLGLFITSPNKSLHKSTCDYFESQAISSDIELIDCPEHCRLFVRLPQPDDDTPLSQVESSKEASMVLNHNTFIAKRLGRFSSDRLFR